MTKSPISLEAERTSRILRDGAQEQIQDYNRRFELVRNIYDDLISSLILSGFNYGEGYETAREFFGSDTAEFAAVDGTEYSRTMLDLIIFYGGSCAARGKITFHSDRMPSVSYSPNVLKEQNGVSSCVPMHINEMVEVEQTYFDPNDEDRISPQKSLSDELMINNATVAEKIMTLSEFYLAFRIASDPSDETKIILLDRSLSNMHSSLIYDTSNPKLWKTMTILGLPIDGLPIDKNELRYGRHRIVNDGLGLPPPRGDYLRYCLIYLLEKKGSMTVDEICNVLGIAGEDRRKRAIRYLEKSVKEGYLLEDDGKYSTNPRYEDTWDRLRKMTTQICRHLFENGSATNPLRIGKGDREHWLTNLDLGFLTLLCFYMLIEESWKRKIVLLGITKDTASRDFGNHVIPVFLTEGVWKSSINQDVLRRAPRTDRMLLQWLSMQNHERLKVPWALVEYDSAYRTIVPELEKGRKGHVSGAIKNKIVPEKLFLRSYIQLSEAATDPRLRSNVLSMDRLVYPEFDMKEEASVRFLHMYGGVEEPIETIMHCSKNVRNDLQNMIMMMLEAMSRSSIPEAFGHNIPLFIADKTAKWHYSHNRRIIDGMEGWIVNNRYLRRFIFYMSTFRERRSEYESSRREG